MIVLRVDGPYAPRWMMETGKIRVGFKAGEVVAFTSRPPQLLDPPRTVDLRHEKAIPNKT